MNDGVSVNESSSEAALSLLQAGRKVFVCPEQGGFAGDVPSMEIRMVWSGESIPSSTILYLRYSPYVTLSCIQNLQ